MHASPPSYVLSYLGWDLWFVLRCTYSHAIRAQNSFVFLLFSVFLDADLFRMHMRKWNRVSFLWLIPLLFWWLSRRTWSWMQYLFWSHAGMHVLLQVDIGLLISSRTDFVVCNEGVVLLIVLVCAMLSPFGECCTDYGVLVSKKSGVRWSKRKLIFFFFCVFS